MPKCPYCYREEGSHTHDPILIPNGSKYKWSNVEETILIEEFDISQREYKGLLQIKEIDVQELQDELEFLEVDNGVTPLTVFSPLNTSGIFQITGYHIKEMRDSVEKVLTALSLTKTDYFNYDEEGNHITHPSGDKIEWTDPIVEATDLQKFQVKNIHIEDLRHNITQLYEIFLSFKEDVNYNRVANLKSNLSIRTNIITQISSSSNYIPSKGTAYDGLYFYKVFHIGSNYSIYKFDKNYNHIGNKSLFNSGSYYDSEVRVDENYIYILLTGMGITTGSKLYKINKTTLSITDSLNSSNIYGNFVLSPSKIYLEHGQQEWNPLISYLINGIPDYPLPPYFSVDYIVYDFIRIIDKNTMTVDGDFYPVRNRLETYDNLSVAPNIIYVYRLAPFWISTVLSQKLIGSNINSSDYYTILILDEWTKISDYYDKISSKYWLIKIPLSKIIPFNTYDLLPEDITKIKDLGTFSPTRLSVGHCKVGNYIFSLLENPFPTAYKYQIWDRNNGGLLVESDYVTLTDPIEQNFDLLYPAGIVSYFDYKYAI